MSWNYRVVRRGIIELGEPIDWLEIREVYYYARDGGEGYENIRGWTIDPSPRPGGETLEELALTLHMFRAALNKPVLDMSELEKRIGQEPPHWIKMMKAIRDFEELEEGWDGYHGAKPLSEAIEEAISFCATDAFSIVDMDATLHADGSVLFELGKDGLDGALKFQGDRHIVYACGHDAGTTQWDKQIVPLAIREVLERVRDRHRRDAERSLEVGPAQEQETS